MFRTDSVSRGIGVRARLVRLVMVMALVTTMLVAGVGPGVQPSSAATGLDSLGTDFWIAFPGNYSSPTLTLFLTGPTATSGTVDAPGIAFTAPFTVTPGTVTSVEVPSSLDIQTSDTVEDLGIHVTAAAEVTVYGLNRVEFTTDAYLGLPTDILGTEYIVQGYENVDVLNASQFALVATQNATTVTINPTVTTDGHTAGTPYNVSLNQGQTYQLRNTDAAPADLSGSIVTADKPIAVFGGHQCANIPAGSEACDHIVEEMTPTVTWGKSFVTEPLATRTGGDTFRFLASTDTTTVQVNGSTVATLNRGQLFEQIVTAASVVTSDKPILVTQYSNSSSFDGVTSDPFEVIVPPAEQFLNSYTVTTPATGFITNFINVVAPTASLASVKLDGVVVPGASFTAIPGSTFSGAQLAVDLGSHTLEGAQPFGVTVYGFADFDSYGYPGGLSLAPVATVTSVALAPKTATNPVDTEHCVTATVKDENAQPVVGVRVDFTVTGVNPTSGFANTDASGQASFCYTGTNPGADSIEAAVGTITDTAAKQWTNASSLSTAIVGVPEPVTAGFDVQYTVTVTNNDETSVADVEVTDTLPAGTTFVSASPGCVGTGPVTCSLGTIAGGSSTSVDIVVGTPTSSAGTTITDSAVTTPGGSTATFDTHPVAATGDSADGFVPPSGGSITTGGDNASTLSLPTGPGARVTLDHVFGAGFCTGTCTGPATFVNNFPGYTDAHHPIDLKLTIRFPNRAAARKDFAKGKGYKLVDDPNSPAYGSVTVIPDCKDDPSWTTAQKKAAAQRRRSRLGTHSGIADPSPCIDSRTITQRADGVWQTTYEILYLSNDGGFARR
jgi:uncharacterized repeat protein (TIGR01451 family)